jgi:hypothetical protein
MGIEYEFGTRMGVSVLPRNMVRRAASVVMNP